VHRAALRAGASVALTPLAPLAPAHAAVTGGGQSVKLSDNSPFPAASFGLQVYDDEAAYKYTTMALEAGYRNFFASVLAGNQRGFGKAVRASGIPRDEIYVCGSVLSNRASGADAAYAASKRGCDANFAALGLGQLDMIMLDYPGPDAASIEGQWKALEAMRKEGGVKSLALSNFSPQQLDVVLGLKDTARPTVNQLPFGVGFKPSLNRDLLAANNARGILVQAWSPLRVLSPKAKEICAAIGKPRGKSAQQVALRWIVDKGATYTCQTTSKAHFQEDIDIFDFKLSADELARLDAVGS